MKFSVLLSVYKKESPLYLRQCFDSIKAQTLQPSEIVLVEDGELTPELYASIKQLSNEIQNFKVVSYPKNQGLGYALSIGLKHCNHEVVARMDTDDICKPQRFEKEIQYLEQHPEIDVIGSWIDEFIDTIDNICSTRKVPENNEEIFNFAKSRNPMNHPTVMFRKSAVINAGNYKQFFYFEDYYLWVRMLQNGAKFHNIQESLLNFRQSKDMFGRRGGKKYALTEFEFYKMLYKTRFIGLYKFLKNVALRSFIRIMPNGGRSFIYDKFLRSKKLKIVALLLFL